MGVSVKLSGLDELKAALKKKADAKLTYVVKQNGAELQARAMRFAPVDTGFLRRSIMLTLKDKGLTAEVEATAEYAGYQEYGTRYMNAQPYMKPAFLVQRDIFTRDIQNALGE